MADLKTSLRELSVALIIGIKTKHLSIPINELYHPKTFIDTILKVVNNDVGNAINIANLKKFNDSLLKVISNGFKLGNYIYNCNKFIFNENDEIIWTGTFNKKYGVIDLIVGKYFFSLKEESFILKNMSLNNLLNALTNKHLTNSINVFTKFANHEFNEWFKYSWNIFVNYLQIHQSFIHQNNGYFAKATITDDKIIFEYNEDKLIAPLTINDFLTYMQFTNTKIREKLVAYWIFHYLRKDKTYRKLKRQCNYVTGAKLANYINQNYCITNIHKFLQIFPFTYYYAKIEKGIPKIWEVPTSTQANLKLQFIEATFKATNQLYLITKFRNLSNKILTFYNECRYSHGQFNGTPEAKLYVDKSTCLDNLFTRIK